MVDPFVYSVSLHNKISHFGTFSIFSGCLRYNKEVDVRYSRLPLNNENSLNSLHIGSLLLITFHFVDADPKKRYSTENEDNI